VTLTVTLSNPDSNRPAKILDWLNPCADKTDAQAKGDVPVEMSFFTVKNTRAEAAAANYLGAIFKRSEPQDKDFLVLRGGQSISCSIPMDAYYEFAGGGGSGNGGYGYDTYSFQYSTTSSELSSPSGNASGNSISSSSTSKLESLESNVLTLKVGARRPIRVPTIPSPPRNLQEKKKQRDLQSGVTSFNGCTAYEQGILITSRQKALEASVEAVESLKTVKIAQDSTSCPRYTTWFGSYSSIRHDELQTGYENIRYRLDDANIKFDCSTCNGNYYAYVYPSRPYQIFMCNAFWSAPMLGYNSKMGTTIHEISHFTIVAETDDYAYGESDCAQLAISNPQNAINNADNHEYYAENASPNYSGLACGNPGPTPSPRPTPSPTPCQGQELTVNILTDEYGSETTWDVLDVCDSNAMVGFGGGYEKKTRYIEKLCVKADNRYKFTIKDSYGDGLCCEYGDGEYSVTFNGDTFSGGEFDSDDVVSFGQCGPVNPDASFAPSESPSSTPSESPSSTPTESHSSTPSVLPSSTPSKSPSSTPSESHSSTPSVNPTSLPSSVPSRVPSSQPSSIPTNPTPVTTTTAATTTTTTATTTTTTEAPPATTTTTTEAPPTTTTTTSSSSTKTITIEFLTDGYPQETSWKLTNTCTGSVVADIIRGGYTNPNDSYSHTFIVPDGAFEFNILDQYGDGICCGYGSGEYTIKFDGNQVASGGNFGSSKMDSFGRESCPPDPPTPAPQPIITASHDSVLGVPKCTTVGGACTSGPTLVKGRGTIVEGSEPNQPNSLDSCTDGNSGTHRSDEHNDMITVRAANGGLLRAGTGAIVEAQVWAYGTVDTADFYYSEDVNPVSWKLIGSVGADSRGDKTLTTGAFEFILPSTTLQAVRVNFRYQGRQKQSACSGGQYDDVDDLVFTVAPAIGNAKTLPAGPSVSLSLKPANVDCGSADEGHCKASAYCLWKGRGRFRKGGRRGGRCVPASV